METKKPKTKPKATQAEVVAHIPKALMNQIGNVPAYLVGIRGYYANTFGQSNKNDRVYFDDALFIIGIKDAVFKPFNFNSDPSLYYRKGLATLKANEVYDVVKHKHKGKYNALQIVKDKVIRDGVTGIDIGRHGINFHYDYEYYSRDSLGCQTLPVSQWNEYLESVYALMTRNKMQSIKYVLTEGYW